MGDRRVRVIGDGPAGCAAAIALARRGVPVTIVRAATEQRGRHGGESLPPAIAPLLSGLDLLSEFTSGPHLRCYGNESAWGHPALHLFSFMTSPHGCGWHIDRPAFDRMLLSAAARAGARITDASDERDAGAFVVDATGRDAGVARSCGVTRTYVDHLIALLSSWRTSSSRVRSSTSLVEAAEHGYWYSAPLPFNRMFCAYVTDSELWARRQGSACEVWQALLKSAPHTSKRLADYEPTQSLRVVPAGTSRLRAMHGDGWLAAGDAAACRDPLSSGGIYEALRSGVRAADAIARHFDGEPAALAHYADDLEARFTRDLLRRRHFYSREHRWPESSFWANRRKSVSSWRPDTSV